MLKGQNFINDATLAVYNDEYNMQLKMIAMVTEQLKEYKQDNIIDVEEIDKLSKYNNELASCSTDMLRILDCISNNTLEKILESDDIGEAVTQAFARIQRKI